jgi:hypothetical protein
MDLAIPGENVGEYPRAWPLISKEELIVREGSLPNVTRVGHIVDDD